MGDDYLRLGVNLFAGRLTLYVAENIDRISEEEASIPYIDGSLELSKKATDIIENLLEIGSQCLKTLAEEKGERAAMDLAHAFTYYLKADPILNIVPRGMKSLTELAFSHGAEYAKEVAYYMRREDNFTLLNHNTYFELAEKDISKIRKRAAQQNIMRL